MRAGQPLTLYDRYMRFMSSYRRWRRLLFPSAAEIKFIQLMGGHVWLLPVWSGKSSLAIVSLGKTLRRYRFKREVRCGRYYMDFANDLGWAIEVDGARYHMDVVADFDREVYIRQRGWRMLRVPAYRVFHDPNRVWRDVLKYITE